MSVVVYHHADFFKIRLTYNYWRKGGYSVGSEDYRWNLIKEHIGMPLFFVLNVVFISTLQSVWLLIDSLTK